MIILIVDDDDGIVTLLAKQLSELGEIRTARSLSEALSQMKRLPPPDFILLDLIFAGPELSSALETLEQIKLIKSLNEKAVVLAMTGSVDESIHTLALQMGANASVKKHDIPTQRRLFEACRDVFQHTGGQSMLDCLNNLLKVTPQ